MEKPQFDTLMLAITGLDAKLSAQIDDLKANMDERFDKVDERLDRVEKKLDVVYIQTGKNTEDIAELKVRVLGPSA